MPQDYQDASYSNNTGLNGQATPTFYNTAGALTTVNSLNYLALAVNTTGQLGPSFQFSTQDNNSPGVWQGNMQAIAGQVAAAMATPSNSPGVMGSGNLAVVASILATPSNTPGVMGSGNLITVPAQLTTQVNPFPTVVTGLSNVMAEQVLAVVGPVYNSPGGILNKAANTGAIVTGGGP